jgi:hypothetical protein
MKLFTGTIAYLPRPHKGLMDLTERSCKSSEQFKALGDVVAYHAQDALPMKPEVCSATHSCLVAADIREYYNGSLMGNWGQLILDGFEGAHADWTMFVSNDVIWNEGAVDKVREYLETADPMTYVIVIPTAIFCLSRKLWEAMKPNWFEDYLPASWEDHDLACQVWAAGGDAEWHAWDSFLTHEIMGTIHNLGGDYRNGTNMANWKVNCDIYHRRWGTGWESWGGKPSKEWVESVRRSPQRP